MGNVNNKTSGYSRHLVNASLSIVSLLVFLLLCEITARAIVYFTWSETKKRYYTESSAVRGGITTHPVLPYVLNPNHNYRNPESLSSKPNIHNSLGFRGKEISIEKKTGTFRIVAIGDSTTYGIRVDPDETYSARLEELLSRKYEKVEVINGGVPGWISTDTLINLQLNIVPLKPDLIIIYQGRNELFPQSFQNFQRSYTHFRRSDYNVMQANKIHKHIFSLSHFAMVLSTFRGHRFGWSELEEDPPYAVINYDNQPNDAQTIRNLEDPVRSETYREAVRSMIAISQSRGIKVILATMAFQATRFSSGVLNIGPKDSPGNKNDPDVYDALQRQVEENNEIVEELARDYGVVVAKTSSLNEFPEFFLGDGHFNADGHRRRAEILYDAIVQHDIIGPEFLVRPE